MTEAISEDEISLEPISPLEDCVEERKEFTVNTSSRARDHIITGVLSAITAPVTSAVLWFKYNNYGDQSLSSGDYFVLIGGTFVVIASTLLSIYNFYKAHKYLKEK